MKWFLNLLKGIWRGITKAWSWVVSKIKNIFSSKKNNNTDSEKVKTEKQNQQQSRQEEVVVTPEQSAQPIRKIAVIRPTERPKVNNNELEVSSTDTYDLLFRSLPNNLISQIDKLPYYVKFSILEDESILKLIKEHPKFSAIFINKECAYSTDSYSKYIKPLFRNHSILGLFERDDQLRSIFCSKEIHLDRNLINLLEHLASRDEATLNRIKTHANLAKEIISTEVIEYIKIFEFLFSQDQKELLELASSDFQFVRWKLYGMPAEERNRFIQYTTNNPENMKLLKTVHSQYASGSAFQIVDLCSRVTPVDIDKSLCRRIFFNHLYKNLAICKIFSNLAKNIQDIQDISLCPKIYLQNKPLQDSEKNHSTADKNIFYNPESDCYIYVIGHDSCINDISEEAIGATVHLYFNIIKEILRERLPDYLKEKLPHPPNTVDLVYKALSDSNPDSNVSTYLNKPHKLSLTCLTQVVESLNR